MGVLLIAFLGAIVGTAGAYFWWIDKHDRLNWRKYIPWTVPWFVVSLAMTGVIGGVLSVAEDGYAKYNDYSSCEPSIVEHKIVSTSRETSMSGSFVLGTGGVNTINRYYAYVQYEKGLMLKTFYVNETYIVEAEHEPYYKRIDYYCPMKLYDFLWWSSDNMRYNQGKFGTLHVPKNTIMRDFKL